LSYISEAAACVLDRQLQTFIVPHTEIVWLSSKAFNYDWFDRRAYYRKGKPLPQKVGSFQIFLDGFRDANLFLRENPWPDRYNPAFNTDVATRKTTWASMCFTGVTGEEPEEGDSAPQSSSPTQDPSPRFQWTEALQQNFREELEKLVILDYMMRNTGIIMVYLLC
jgi:phosphatidylinositol 4-kinase type 2